MPKTGYNLILIPLLLLIFVLPSNTAFSASEGTKSLSDTVFSINLMGKCMKRFDVLAETYGIPIDKNGHPEKEVVVKQPGLDGERKSIKTRRLTGADHYDIIISSRNNDELYSYLTNEKGELVRAFYKKKDTPIEFLSVKKVDRSFQNEVDYWIEWDKKVRDIFAID